MFMRDGHIVMLYDHFCEGYFGASQSDDGLRWASITARMQFPPEPRHTSVIEVDDAVAKPLRHLA
jgi:beta-galactosidase